ncbi:MAG: TetR/AcrR family transcriptional regulator [Candidatus Kapabacteria bacterium]|nr:TetR/AcrR family transcriptional regulator [Candidatus Kapabacteria bacterium]
MARKEAAAEQKDAKRGQLVQAAVRVFAQKGYHAAKMQEIADAAGVGKGTIYEYFATKDDLFLAVYDTWMDGFEAAMEQAYQSHGDPIRRADAMIDTAIGFYEQHAAHAAILLEFWAHALRSSDPHFLERIRQMKQKLASLGASVTKQLVALKAFDKVDVESFALLELGISDGIFLQWVLDGQTYSLHDAYKFRQSVIGAGLMSTTLRTVMKPKTSRRLKQGFIAQTKKS